MASRFSSPYYKPRSVRRLEKNSRRNLIITILISIGILYALLTWGLPLFIGALASIKPKSQASQNPAVEDAAIAPPVLNIPFEATNSAEIRISGYAASNAKVEIYVDNDLKETVDADAEGKFQSEKIPLSVGTNNIHGQTVNDDGKKSLPSKNIRVIFSNEKPKLELTEPQDGHQIQGGDKRVRVSGKTGPANTISVNGFVVVVNNEGNFSTEIGLNDGENTITVTSSDTSGNSTSQSRKVIYNP